MVNFNDAAKNVFLLVSMAALAIFAGFTIYAMIFGASILDPVYPETPQDLGWLNFRSFLVGCITAYVLGVVADINARGDVCCIQDPNAGDEIVVKRDNVLAENFDILTWDNRPRSGAGIFTGICAPAWF